MLTRIHIRHYALIELLDLQLPGGFVSITGETGAGKSMLLSAIAACLGGKVPKEHLRGQGETVLCCTFRGPGGNGKAPETVCERVIRADGRSRYRLNGEAATQKEIKALAGGLLRLHGQRDQLRLLQPEMHPALLDQLPALAPKREAHRLAHSAWQAAVKEAAELARKLERSREQRELWSYQLRELEELNMRPGEDEELSERQSVLSHTAEIKAGCYTAAQELEEGEEALGDRLAARLRELEKLAAWDRELAEPLERLREAQLQIQEAARALSAHSDRVEDDPAELAKVEERLGELDAMIRKYGGTLDNLLREQASLAERLAGQDDLAERLQAARREEERSHTDLLKKAKALAKARRAEAPELCRRINALLAELGITGEGLSIAFEPQEPEAEEGPERPRFLVATNPDTAPAPLEEIASGGELSRIMLAFQSVLGEESPGGCQVFDEIDTGLSGRAARAVASQLARLAERQQVLCITHLPQIAAAAAEQLGVDKDFDGKRTRITIRRLDEQERLRHIARLQAGKDGPEELAAARRLLEGNHQAAE